ncbi:MAG: hypothetical protein DRH57_08685 [Candidatus Cloacimonadota bacterium]|nr:MAG: hypothetical protein DRH57_08685 [Candidatus Cloacimonadota bacterium]
MLLNYLERVMSKYTDGNKFIYDLNQKYPERLVVLLEVDYTEDELLDYVEYKSVDDFYPQLFRDGLALKRAIIINEKNPTISFHGHIQNPAMGEMALDQATGLLSIYDGCIWVQVDN